VIDLPIGVALLRPTFPDWHIIDDERCFAVRRPTRTHGQHSGWPCNPARRAWIPARDHGDQL